MRGSHDHRAYDKFKINEAYRPSSDDVLFLVFVDDMMPERYERKG
ncbi:hypothetical protein HMPREF9412_2546 [Paenibacillus sp. HGF5]|nr:hypothetical protein HMPREF9412_2546 [Paenibacillus sp. HGF5]